MHGSLQISAPNPHKACKQNKFETKILAKPAQIRRH
jgi:hypothetical protein